MTENSAIIKTGDYDTERLDQLIAVYARLKPQVDELTNQLKLVTTAIKATLQEAAVGKTQVDVVSPVMTDGVLRMVWKSQRRLDSKRLKAEMPWVYEQYAVASGHWELRKVPR